MSPATVEYLDRGTDRLGIHSYPAPAEDAPPMVVLPAMGAPAGYYRPLAQALGAAGFAVSVLDLRGTGASTPRPSRRSRYGYRELVGDIDVTLDLIRERSGGQPVYLLGHSLGGQLALLHCALSGALSGAASGASGAPAGVAGVALVAAGLPWYRSFHGARPPVVLAVTQSIVGAASVLRVWPGWGFGGRQSRGVMRDWGYTARTGRFPALDEGVDMAAALAGLRLPILAISVEGDPYTPPPTLDHLCARLGSATISRVHLNPSPKPAHFAWARSPEAVVSQVASFAAQGFAAK